MHRSSPFRSTLNTGYITGLDMCKVCTETVHSVALWTRVTLQVWTRVKYVPKQSIAQRFEHVCKCKRMSSSPPHPTLSHVMCARVTLGGKNDAKLCICVAATPVCVRRVTLENGCVRTWLQSVCAGDSGWKKWCKIVPVCTRVCARGTPWPHWAGSDGIATWKVFDDNGSDSLTWAVFEDSLWWQLWWQGFSQRNLRGRFWQRSPICGQWLCREFLHDQLRICLHFSSCWMMEMVKSHWILDVSNRFRALVKKTHFCEICFGIERCRLCGK